MKLSALLFIFLLLASTLLGQTDTSSLSTEIDLSKMVTKKDGYLQKSRAQKTTAFVLLGIGTATVITGAIMMNTAKNNIPVLPFPTDNKSYDGAGLILLGILVDLGSIPFFISSSKNKEKAMTFSLKNEPIPNEMIPYVKHHSIPALSAKWKFQ